MELINFNNFQQNQRMYGGTAGRKMGITYNGKDYLVKFPGNLKEQKMKNINLSYSNSPVCEYIGSNPVSIFISCKVSPFSIKFATPCNATVVGVKL